MIRRLEVVISSDHGEAVLQYRLLDRPIVRRWARLLETDLARGSRPWMGGIFYGHAFNRASSLTQEINSLLKSLDFDQRGLFSELVSDSYDQPKLDRMHWIKERLVHLATQPGFAFPPQYHHALARLNFLIHRMESVLRPPSSDATAVVVPMPLSREPLNDEDYAEFEIDHFANSVYLDYATNGITVLDAFRGNSGVAPTPQSTCTSGFNLVFGNDYPFRQREQLERWIRQTLGRDPKDPRLALGAIRLGALDAPNSTPLHALTRLESPTVSRVRLFDSE